jgi:hypothetical protein
MGNFKIDVKGSVGQIGDGNTAQGMVVNNAGTANTQVIAGVAADLEKLRQATGTALGARQPTPEETQDLLALESAETSAKSGDAVGLLAASAKFGGWLLGVAKDIGVQISAEVLKGRLGL